MTYLAHPLSELSGMARAEFLTQNLAERVPLIDLISRRHRKPLIKGAAIKMSGLTTNLPWISSLLPLNLYPFCLAFIPSSFS